MNPFVLTNKHIVVSGASSGIGKQCAISCAAMGAKVSLIGRNCERLEQTLLEMEGSGHTLNIADLSIEQECKKITEQIVANSGRIDGLLNVAGISSTLLIKSVTGHKIDELFKNNIYSAYILTREVCKLGNFSKNGGSIVFISSIMGTHGQTGKSLYSMTKGALVAASKSLACELAPKKIRVNSISPGLIITPLNENLPHIKDITKKRALEDMHLLGLGKPLDVANAAVFLLSNASSWITGINLYVDGGYTSK